MDIYLTILIGLLGLCVGAIIGLGIDSKINRDYIVGMNNITKEYLEKVIDLEKGYFNTITTDLAKAVDDINKVYEKPIWRKQKKNYHHVQDCIMAKLKVIHMEKMLCGK